MLSPVHIAISERPLNNGPRKRDLDGTQIGQLEDHYVGWIDAIETSDDFWVSHSRSANSIEGLLIREENVDGEPKRTGVLGPNATRHLV